MTKTKAQRTCIACGSKQLKSQMIRIVRSPSYLISYDPSGNAAGRGAYVCNKECFERACAHKRWTRALRMKIDENDLMAIGEGLETAL